MGVLTTSRTGATAISTMAIVLGAATAAGAVPSATAAARPGFRAPWPCGQSRDYFHHSGEVANAIDFNIPGSADLGTPALASAAGTVRSAGSNGGYGNEVVVDHGGGWSSRVAHLSAFSVKVGQVVRTGQELGKVGSTGNSSGPHLHYEQFSGGTRVPIVIDSVALLYDGATRQHTSKNCGSVGISDWSGDGYADVLGADAAGDLWYYANNGLQLSARKKLGDGWATFRHVKAADWSGDGYADVIGVDGAGDLWYYPHSGNGLGVRQKIGAGWKDFRHVVAADWSGDGYADVIGADAAGDLWYYPHNGNGLGVRQKIGAGWKDFRFVRAMDFSGDGYADVIGVDAAGDMWYYPHNGNGLGARKKIGAGWANFTHIL